MGIEFNVNEEITSGIFKNQFSSFGKSCLEAIDSVVNRVGRFVFGCFGKAELVKGDFKFTDLLNAEKRDGNGNADDSSLSLVLAESITSVMKVAAENFAQGVRKGIEGDDEGEVNISFGNASLKGKVDIHVDLNKKGAEASDDGKFRTSFSVLGHVMNIAVSEFMKPKAKLGGIELKLKEEDGKSEFHYKYYDPKTKTKVSGPVSFIKDLFLSIFSEKEEEGAAPAA